jgi:hypothetical protein
MKKSILFSSIAVTTCLLIQHSASAEWFTFSDQGIEANLNHSYSGWYGPVYGNWSLSESKSSLDLRNESKCSVSMNSATGLFQSSSSVSANNNSYGKTRVYSNMYFTVTENSIINLDAKIWLMAPTDGGPGSGHHEQGDANTNIIVTLDKMITFNSNWINVDSFNLETSTSYGIHDYSNSGTFNLLSGIARYRISLDISSEASGTWAAAQSSFSMSLTPVPAPAASALFALAGFVSRRRRA